jgi:hypothetical protein
MTLVSGLTFSAKACQSLKMCFGSGCSSSSCGAPLRRTGIRRDVAMLELELISVTSSSKSFPGRLSCSIGGSCSFHVY